MTISGATSYHRKNKNIIDVKDPSFSCFFKVYTTFKKNMIFTFFKLLKFLKFYKFYKFFKFYKFYKFYFFLKFLKFMTPRKKLYDPLKKVV